MLFCAVFAPAVVACHLQLSRPDPTKPMLMSQTEFFCMFCLTMGCAAAIIFVSTHTRRVHHASLLTIAEL